MCPDIFWHAPSAQRRPAVIRTVKSPETGSFKEASRLSDVLELVYLLKRLVPPVTVHFMCHLDWTMGCLDLWSNIILGVSVGVFGMWISVD